MSMSAVLSSSAAVWFLQSLAHFLWQGTLVCLVGAACAALLHRHGPRCAHTVWCATLLAMVACIPLTCAWLASDAPLETAAPPPRSASRAAAPDPAVVRASANGRETAVTGATAGRTGPVKGSSASSNRADAGVAWTWQSAAGPLLLAYVGGIVLMLLRLVISTAAAARLTAGSRPVEDKAVLDMITVCARKVGLRSRPAVAWSQRVSTPLVVGVLRPLVLLPAGLATHLDSSQLMAIVIHEFAHLRRFDPLVNILQRLVESLWFFHPAVWYVSRRIGCEREYCCDQRVLLAGTDAACYAESLIRLSELRAASGRVRPIGAVLGAATDRPSHLRQRVLRILGGTPPSRPLVPSGRSMTLITAVILLCLLPTVLPGTGRTAARPTNRTSSTTEPQSAADETVQTVAQTDDPRVLVDHWMTLVSTGRERGSWSLTTNSEDLDAQHVLRRLPDGTQLRITRSLGNDSSAVVVTAPFQDEYDQTRAFAFWLVRRDHKWLINRSYADAPADIEEQLRGFYAGTAVNWHVAPADLIGRWESGPGWGACIVNADFRDDHTFELKRWDPAGDCTIDEGEWSVESDRLVLSYGDQTLTNRVIWLNTTERRLESLDGKRRIALQRARRRPADSDTRPADPWGEPIGGVSVRLKADQSEWQANEPPRLRVEIRNTGEQTWRIARAQEVCEVEVDGEWYVFAGPYSVKTSHLAPGAHYTGIEITPGPLWKEKSGRGLINLTTGPHTIRVAVFPNQPGMPPDQRQAVVTNAVEIRVQ